MTTDDCLGLQRISAIVCAIMICRLHRRRSLRRPADWPRPPRLPMIARFCLEPTADELRYPRDGVRRGGVHDRRHRTDRGVLASPKLPLCPTHSRDARRLAYE